MSWALYIVRSTASRKFRVGEFVSCGRKFATVESVFRRRVSRALIVGLYQTEELALRARDRVEDEAPWDLIAQKAAAVGCPGYSPVEEAA